MTQRWFEDFMVGDRFASPSKTLTDAHFLFFAGMTGDNHPIHYDDEYAKGTRFGRRLAHGLMLMSLTAVGGAAMAGTLVVWAGLACAPRIEPGGAAIATERMRATIGERCERINMELLPRRFNASQ